LSIARTDIVAKLSGKIVIDAIDRGAESIVVACPMCQSNLDMRRTEIEGYMNKQTDVPVIYITQAIGLALGIPEEKLGFKRHMVPVEPMIRANAAAQAALAAEAAKKAQTVKEEV
jgi:heterodisulfide reductase subunit B